MSRIIVKNIPKEYTELDLKNHFNKKGEITDIKIMRKENGESRKFAFLGFKTLEQAKESLKYYHNTYIKTCRISVEEAKVQGDPTLSKNRQNMFSKPKKGKQGENADSNAESNVDTQDKNSKEKKIKQLLKLAKTMSNKNKFDAVEQKMREREEKGEQGETTQSELVESSEKNEKTEENSEVVKEEKKINPRRLYLRNIAFEVKEDDIRNFFEKFGELTEVHIPINRKTNQSFGYAYIAYATVESAVLAISEMDKTIFQGRILHITPALEKEEKGPRAVIEPKPQNPQGNTLSEYKKQKKEKQKENFDNETNWNYLFMNQNAVIESISKKLNIPKSEIMSRDNANLAVQVAAMETTVIQETKDWLSSQGINLDILKGKRSQCVRSKNIILIKNIHPNVNKEKLEEYFSRYGVMVRFILSANNTIGIAEFMDKKHAENCMKKLAYFEIEGTPLYLEYAPEGLIRKNTKSQENFKEENTTNTDNSSSIDLKKDQGKILFITNLNFSTKENRLKKFFEEKGFKTVTVKIVSYKKDDSDKALSAGYGFVELDSEESAGKAIRTLQGALLDAHSIKLSIAHTKDKEKERSDQLLKNKRKAETDLNDYEYEGDEVTNNKILCKNLAFEANKDELRSLFKTFGEVKTVRLPTKLDGSHRGFAFVEFVSSEEAKNAFKSLLNTHFYGRKLVLEWAQKEKSVEDLREETQRKVNAINIKTHRTQIKSTMEFKK
jgi:multiple RNA-binding domain-containing protein 1